MSELILITGTIYDGMDLNGLLDEPIIIESLYQDPTNPDKIIIEEREYPILVYGTKRTFNIVQGVSSGKTFYAVHLLAQKAYGFIKKDLMNGGKGIATNCYANLGLAWRPENIDVPADKWTSSLNTIDDFEQLINCTILLDDASNSIPFWNSEQARAIGACANAMGKLKKDIIITAQREPMIPPAIRDMATEWVVPLIIRRNYLKPTPRGDGYPEKMVTLHFNGAKGLEYISDPITHFEKVFEAYKTVEIATGLTAEGGKTMQPGRELEVKAFEFLKSVAPKLNWQHLNGKHVFDVVCDTHAIDVCAMDEDGNLRTEHKNLLRHLKTTRKTGQIPYLMFPYKDSFGFIKITTRVADAHSGNRIDTSNLKVKTIDGLI